MHITGVRFQATSATAVTLINLAAMATAPWPTWFTQPHWASFATQTLGILKPLLKGHDFSRKASVK